MNLKISGVNNPSGLRQFASLECLAPEQETTDPPLLDSPVISEKTTVFQIDYLMHKLLHCNAGPRQPQNRRNDHVYDNVTDDRVWLHDDALVETNWRSPDRRDPDRPRPDHPNPDDPDEKWEPDPSSRSCHEKQSQISERNRAAAEASANGDGDGDNEIG